MATTKFLGGGTDLFHLEVVIGWSKLFISVIGKVLRCQDFFTGVICEEQMKRENFCWKMGCALICFHTACAEGRGVIGEYLFYALLAHFCKRCFWGSKFFLRKI